MKVTLHDKNSYIFYDLNKNISLPIPMQVVYDSSIEKRYFLIDQQKARHFVHVFTTLLPFYGTQIIYPLFTSRLSANYNKGLGF